FCYLIEVLCALLLLVFTMSGLKAVWPVFAVMTLFGVARAFSMPSSQALIPNLVPIEKFGNAVALNSSMFQVSTIAGPTLGGVLYLAGVNVVYSTVAVLIGISVVLMIGVKPLREPTANELAASGKKKQSWHDLLEGLRFVRSRPVVLGAISMDLFAVLFGGATAMLPAYASDVLEVGPAGLGFLRTAPGVGAALVALSLAIVPIQRNVGRWMFAGVALFGVATIVFAVSKIFALSLIALI